MYNCRRRTKVVPVRRRCCLSSPQCAQPCLKAPFSCHSLIPAYPVRHLTALPSTLHCYKIHVLSKLYLPFFPLHTNTCSFYYHPVLHLPLSTGCPLLAWSALPCYKPGTPYCHPAPARPAHSKPVSRPNRLYPDCLSNKDLSGLWLMWHCLYKQATVSCLLPFCTFWYTHLQALPASQLPVATHTTRLMQQCHSGQLTTLL